MRKVSIGKQDYESLIKSGCFYVDKTYFIKEWWESQDDVTLITRPRRFGKTLNMSMLECFSQINMRAEVICLRGCRYGMMKSTDSFRGHTR